MDFLRVLVTAYLHRQWLMCNGPGQEGLHISSRSIVAWGSNHRTSINVTVSLNIADRSSLCGSGSATGWRKTGRSIELSSDTSKKQTASPQSAFFFLTVIPAATLYSLSSCPFTNNVSRRRRECKDVSKVYWVSVAQKILLSLLLINFCPSVYVSLSSNV